MKKQEKKFVLAALALLAITGLLALAGCKNDTVPEPTRYTVKFDKNAEDASGEMQSQIFTEGVEQELSVNQFKRATYTFSGWSEDKAATAPTYKDKAKFKATKDTTLYAVWTDNGTVAPVNFSLPGGTKFYCDESIAVSLTSEEGATIQYHLGDGSWKDYTAGGKIQVTGDTTITARATKDGLKPSAETTATYTVRQLEGITVTPPERTVYSVGEEVVHQKGDEIEVTATYDDEEERTVTGAITTDTSTLTQSAGIGKKVTVSYSEGGSPVTKDFTVDVVNVEEPTKLTSYSSPNNTGNDCTYIAFGEWPQTEAVDFKPTTDSQSHGIFVDTYYVEGNDKYVEKDGKYYKVEPIVWRVLTEDYKDPDGNSTGNALLLAEKILTGGIKWGDFNTYKESYIRQWLNGNIWTTGETSDYNGDAGFLQTAFTQSARDKIADTTVDNSAASTNPASNPNLWENGNNPYASDTPTTDKIFLLSEEEATNSEYGFDEYDRWVGDDYNTTTSTRIRVTTDYAEATGANQDSTPGYGGNWWLRSPYCYYEHIARIIIYDGGAYDYNSVSGTYEGVVPALSISLQ